MSRLTDQELIDELKIRFEGNRKALYDLRALTDQLEKMNRKLQDSESVKTHFLSNIRNEINNPLTSIIGLSRYLMGGKCDPSKVLEVAGMIYSEAFDLDFQLRNIFVAAELEAGDGSPEFAHVDIAALVASTVEMLSHHLTVKGVVVQISGGSPGGATFTTDAQMLQVMLINLLMNAIEFSPAGGTVRVEQTLSGEGLTISVADAGCGIDQAEQERIFDRFRQGESGTTKSHRGHGLGLSITKALVELLNGTICVKSDKGAGAEFILSLPLQDSSIPVSLRAQDGNFFLFEDDDADDNSVQVF